MNKTARPTKRATHRRPALTGVLPVFQTPYQGDERIDFDTLEGEIDWLFQRGADGVVMAMVSETMRLSGEERKAIAAKVCKWARGRGACVISVGAESAFSAVEYARQAEADGATAVMAIPPVSVALGGDELMAYYRRVIEAIQIPVIVQDASGYVGAPMPIAAQARLLERYGEERVLFKPEARPTGPKLSELHQATDGKSRVFEGSGGIGLVDGFRRGLTGTMPGAEIIDAQVALWRALQAGDERRIYQLSFPIASLVALQHGLDGFIAVEKYLLVKQGIFKNTIVRGPVGFHLDRDTQSELDRLFEKLMEALGRPPE